MSPVKSFFQRIPFIRITSLFLLGILAGRLITVDVYWILLLLFLLILSQLLFWNNNSFPTVRVQNIVVSSAIFLAGTCYILQTPDQELHFYDQREEFIAEVCQKPVEKANTFQTVLKIQRAGTVHHEKVMAYFSKEGFDTSIKAGDQFTLFARLQEIKNPGNPFELDYKAIMKNKGITSSVYLSPGTYHKTGKQICRITYVADHVRDQLMALLPAANLGDRERAVISALTLGYRAELDQETMNYFVDTGTIHVLSVSGLHVALIFVILNFFFSPVNSGKYGKYIHGALIIICLWSYAFITGFSPSVQRSTVMFSFVIAGNLLRRPVNIYNSLSASALVLILLDPLVIYDIGFQLSYLAVYGIVLIQPPLEKLLVVKNKLLQWTWALFTVSIAAQLITFPLSVYYFNQFPSLFWLSSFVAIPATTLIIWLSVVFFILSPIGLLTGFFAILMQLTTHLLLDLLKWMSNLPNAVIEGIVYTPFQTLIMYGSIITFVLYAFSKKKKWLYQGLALIISFQASMLWTNYKIFNQKVLYVYQTKGCLIHCINGRNSYVIKYNDQPYTEKEANMIRNVCNHLKLKRPMVINPGNPVGFNTDDLMVSGKTLCFLNCRIDCADQLNIHVLGNNFEDFKIINPSLFKNEFFIPLPDTSGDTLNVKEAFSLVFTAKFKEGVYINMN